MNMDIDPSVKNVLGTSGNVDPEVVANHHDKGNLYIGGIFTASGYKADGTQFYECTSHNTTTRQGADWMIDLIFGTATANAYTTHPVYGANDYKYAMNLTENTVALQTQCVYAHLADMTAQENGYTPSANTQSEIATNAPFTSTDRQEFVLTAGNTRLVASDADNARGFTNFVSGGTDNRPTWTRDTTVTTTNITGALMMLTDTMTAQHGTAGTNRILISGATFTTVGLTASDTLKVQYTFRITAS